jgi:hypothetical protein
VTQVTRVARAAITDSYVAIKGEAIRVRVQASNEQLGYRIEGNVRMVFDKESAPGVVIGHIPALGLVVEAQTEQEACDKLHRVFADFCEVASDRQGKSILDALVARGCIIEPMSGEHAAGESVDGQYLKIFLRRDDAGPVAKATLPGEKATVRDEHLAALK